MTVTFGIQLFLCHPVRKLLVSINQSPHLIYSVYNIFSRSKVSRNIKEMTFADLDLFSFSSFIFKENHVLVEEVIVKEELDGIDIDIMGILKYLLMVESLLKILTKGRSQAFYKLVDVHSVTNILGKSISSITI